MESEQMYGIKEKLRASIDVADIKRKGKDTIEFIWKDY